MFVQHGLSNFGYGVCIGCGGRTENISMSKTIQEEMDKDHKNFIVEVAIKKGHV